jgi:enoyl-CoA hydratase/carnithine racemase
MNERVVYTLVDGVADVRLNRPEKRNALDGAMFQALIDVGEELARDTRVRAVVLSGEGASFCAGLDLATFQEMGATPGRVGGSIGELDGRITHRGQQAAWVWHIMPAPTIAAVTGHALGGGCQIAVGCDLRVVAPDAQLSVLEIRWGLTPDMTITHLLPQLVGLDVAKELTFTGRTVSGTEAVRIGLATRCADNPRAEALEIATEIAGKSPHAVQGAKALLNRALSTSAAQQFADERRVIADMIGSPNQAEAVQAYFEKRSARFVDPAPNMFDIS